ncbi:MAG: response regulator [Methylacidiphilales bacterium]|nr:response regulator [Candidatus Methylacidiphilales bacterium]
MDLVTRESLRIFHIEDEDQFAQLTDVFLKRAGFNEPITRFSCGAAALDDLSSIGVERAPHVILLDLRMPDMEGLELLRWLRKDYHARDVAVYLLTATDDPEEVRQAANAGATKIFFKTALFDELLQELDDLIVVINHKLLQGWNPTLRGAMAELTSMGKYATEMVVLTDAEGRIEWANKLFVRRTGYSLQELRGKIPGKVLQGPNSDPAVIKLLHDAIQSRSSCECRIVNYRKNGTPYPVLISLGPVYSNGKIEGFLAIERDLSEEEKQLPTVAA